MADPIFRTDPGPTGTTEYEGVRIAALPPMARFSLRARDVEILEKLLDRTLPRKIGEMANDTICLGPDEWLLRTTANSEIANGDGDKVSIVDISERSVGLQIDGPRAMDVLLAGCPLDLERFVIGRATRTIFDGVEIILIRNSADSFALEAWRSFAPFIWTTLAKAAAQNQITYPLNQTKLAE